MGLPQTVYFVERIAPEGERVRYYSVSKRRIYQTERHARQFVEANKKSKFKVFKAEVAWEDVSDDFT